MAEGAEGVALASVLCNRGLCYQKMDLHRKALKVGLQILALLLTDSRLLGCSSSFLQKGMYLRYGQIFSIKIVAAHQITHPCVQNYDEALKNLPYFSRAHMGRGKSLQALGRTTVSP